MSESELSRIIKVRPLPGDAIVIEADAVERAALARRFGLPAVESLHAEISVEQDANSIFARGELKAEIRQNCAISGDEFAVSIEEPILLRFVEARAVEHDSGDGDEEIEIELSDEDCDEIEFSGDSFDLGEAIAQSLGLAIDPYAEGPNADEARRRAGISGDDQPSGPLAEALKALKPN